MFFLSVYLGFIIILFKITLFHRSVCLPRTFPTHLSVFPGLELFDSLAAPAAVNAGISLSMVLNVQVPCQLTVLCTLVVPGAKSLNPHRVRHIEGHCNNIHKGKVRVGFWVGDCDGYGNADAHSGWKSVSRICIEEIPKPQA